MEINWENIPTRSVELKKRKSHCQDCAIKTGFYTPFLEDLLKQPREIQIKQGKSWFCHRTRGKICFGASEALNI